MGPARFRCATLLIILLCYHLFIKFCEELEIVISLSRTPTIRVLGSIVVSIPACHAGDRGSIPRRGGLILRTCSFS